jgi:hypothetical protein
VKTRWKEEKRLPRCFNFKLLLSDPPPPQQHLNKNNTLRWVELFTIDRWTLRQGRLWCALGEAPQFFPRTATILILQSNITIQGSLTATIDDLKLQVVGKGSALEL